MASQRLTVYLMRDGINEFADALARDKPSDEYALDESSGIDGRFFRARAVPRKPKWVGFVAPILKDELEDVWSTTASGLLLVRTRDRMFALTFGYGRSLLDLAKIEFQFGLRVALNRIDPTQLRSLDTKTFEDMVVTTATQVSKTAELPAFHVDVSTDILRAATGEPRDRTFAKRLSGSDALVINREAEATDLPHLCGELFDAFSETTYRAEFGWIDHLALVRDPDVIDSLNEHLVADLAAGDTAATHLALPEPISWEEVDAFKIAGSGSHEYDELDLDAYLEQLDDGRSKITVNTLKSRRVSIRFGRSEGFDERWTLYQCLVSEQRLNSVLFVLIEGRWFRVSDSLVDEVDTFVNQIPPSQVHLLPARPGEPEGSYNERVSSAAPSSLLKLDAKIKRPGGAASGIELCDVLSGNGEFIHVKRKARSATLSHLFAQGRVSATTFHRDGPFRDQIREIIESDAPSDDRSQWLDLVPSSDEQVDRSRYCITFAVVANSNKERNDWLPFFSKLNLMQQGRQLKSDGFNIALMRIPVVEPLPSQ